MYKYIKHLVLTKEPLIKTTTNKIKRNEELKKKLLNWRDSMHRVKLADRVLPTYTKGEEIFNMVSHIVGGAPRYCCSCFMCYIFSITSQCLWYSFYLNLWCIFNFIIHYVKYISWLEP